MMLNRRKVKLFTLEIAKGRAHKFTRVGSEFYDRCEVNLKEFIRHQVLHHGKKEYVRDDAYTNTIEGYFSIFKRGMVGVYQQSTLPQAAAPSAAPARARPQLGEECT